MTPFELDHEPVSLACVVRVSGDLDMAVVADLRAGLGQAFEAGCENVVLDLGQVVYADSSALGLLVWMDHRLRPVERQARDSRRLGGRLSSARDFGTGFCRNHHRDGGLGHVGARRPRALGDTQRGALGRDVVVEADVNSLAGVREHVCELLEPLGFASRRCST